MKRNTRVLFLAMTILLVLSIPSAAWAQQKHGKKGGMPGMKMDMAKMMKSPHHKLMMAYMKSMSAFATTLRAQAMKPEAIDVEVARATVAELRHNLDAMDALKQKHMQGMSTEIPAMSAEMQSKMKMMMEKMDKATDEVKALETAVQADKPDSAQVTAHANALLKHLGMMSMMAGGGEAAKKKMAMKKDMKMEPKTEPKMDMKKKM